MARLARKYLMVDADKVRDLAQIRGTSESQTVRQAGDFAPAAEDVMAALRELHERGGLNDVFGRLPVEAEMAREPSSRSQDLHR